MSFYRLPHPWDPNYAIPRSVMAEPPERGTFTTQWMPRGTIPQLVPDYLAKPGRKLLGRDDAELAGLGSLGGSTLTGSTLGGGHTLAKNTLSGHSLAREYELTPLGVTPSPNKAAAAMVARARALPKELQQRALKGALNAIHPTLGARAERHALAHRRRGVHPTRALEAGIATALSEKASRSVSQSGQRHGLGDNTQMSALSTQQFVGQPVGGVGTTKAIRVGPFTLAYKESTGVTYRLLMMTDEQKKSLNSYLAKLMLQAIGPCIANAMSCTATGRNYLSDYGWDKAGTWVSPVPNEVINGTMPIAYFDHPETGRRQGVFFKIDPKSTKANPMIQMWWREERTLVELLVDGLTKLVAEIIDLAQQIVCGVAGTSPVAGAAIGAATGVGPGGVNNLCGGPQVPLPPPTSSFSIMPYMLMAGGGLLLLVLARRQ